jgi:hypothetical protein
MKALSLRVQAWIALFAFLGGLALPLASARHETFEDDAACATSLRVSGADGLARVGVTSAIARPAHCAVCHWLRAVSGATTTGAAPTSVWLEPGALASAPSGTSPLFDLQSNRPARAPPASIA